MRYIHLSKSKTSHLLYVFFLFSLISCGTNVEPSQSDENYLSIQLEWPFPNTDLLSSGENRFEKNVCDDFGVEDISVIIHDSSGTRISQNDWKCRDHYKSIKGVPIGTGYTIDVMAYVSGNPDWQGKKEHLSINKGMTRIQLKMAYEGEDLTPPSILATEPPNHHKDVLIHKKIEIHFDDRIMPSSISPSSFFVEKGSDKVAGTIETGPEGKSLFFLPKNPMLYATDYRVTLTEAIRDKANNPLSNPQSFTFKTCQNAETVPDPPKAFKAQAGYRKITLSWDPVPHASYYNVYMSQSNTISKEAGGYMEVRQSNTTTLSWEMLNQGEIYYFIVTAANTNSESDASVVASETPELIPFQSHLVSFYDFIDATAHVNDLSDNNNHGLPYNVVKAKDRFGTMDRALYFDGSSAYVQADHLTGLDPSSFSLVLIIRRFEHTKDAWILTKGYNHRNFSLQIYGESSKDAGKLFYSHVNDSGSVNESTLIKVSNDIIPLMKDIHIVITYQKIPNSPDNRYRFTAYLDGVRKKRVETFKPPSNHSPLIIGAGGNKSMSSYYKGVIDDFILYNRPLSTSEVQTIYEYAEMNKRVKGSATNDHQLAMPTSLKDYDSTNNWNHPSAECP